MAVASGPAGLVLAGPVFNIFGTAHAQTIHWRSCTDRARTTPWLQQLEVYIIDSTEQDDIPEKPHNPANYKFSKHTFGQKTAMSHAFQSAWFSQWQWQ